MIKHCRSDMDCWHLNRKECRMGTQRSLKDQSSNHCSPTWWQQSHSQQLMFLGMMSKRPSPNLLVVITAGRSKERMLKDKRNGGLIHNTRVEIGKARIHKRSKLLSSDPTTSTMIAGCCKDVVHICNSITSLWFGWLPFWYNGRSLSFRLWRSNCIKSCIMLDENERQQCFYFVLLAWHLIQTSTWDNWGQQNLYNKAMIHWTQRSSTFYWKVEIGLTWFFFCNFKPGW